jgi:hypothetical protein
MYIPTNTELGARLAVIVDTMREPIGQRANRGGVVGVLLGVLFWRLVRMVGRLDRLILRWQAGKLRPERESRVRRSRGQPVSCQESSTPGSPLPESLPQPASPRMPRGHGWLIRLAQPTAQAAMMVEFLMADAEAAGLFAAAPQAGRIFRPLCRMLGIPIPPALRLPPRPPPPSCVRPRKAPRPRLPPLGPLLPVGFRPSAIVSRKFGV